MPAILAHVDFEGFAFWLDATGLVDFSSARPPSLTRCSIDATLAHLRKSELVQSAALEETFNQTKTDSDGESLLRRLASEGKLTRYQAEQLSRGRTTFDLGPYRITDWFGFGVVCHLYLAEHRVLGQPAILKIARDAHGAVRLLKEATLFRDAAHQQVARVLYLGRDRDVHFLAGLCSGYRPPANWWPPRSFAGRGCFDRFSADARNL